MTTDRDNANDTDNFSDLIQDSAPYQQEGLSAAGDPRGSGAVARLERVWRSEANKAFPTVKVARWFTSTGKPSKEAGQMGVLLDKYNGDEGTISKAVEHVFRHWGDISGRFKKAPSVPTVGFLLALHDALVPEATEYVSEEAVHAEANEWLRQHPGAATLPADMLKRLQRAKKGA